MKSAAVYSCRSRSNSPSRETLVYDQLDSALAARAELDRHVLPELERKEGSANRKMPDLASVKAHEAIVALGYAAHNILADFEKRTLVAGDLDLEAADVVQIEDIEALVWSCTNTMGMVALGAAAWHSVQLLPIGDRRFHHVPPLRLAAGTPKASVLIIDHEVGETSALALVDALKASGLKVEYVGSNSPGALSRDTCWSDDALIHVHVGEHTLDAVRPRLVDSWRSERLALQLFTDRRARRPLDPDALMIEDAVNGIICGTAEDVASACRELIDDGVLRQKLIAAGQSTVAPLMNSWGAIAEDLLA